MCNGDGTCIDEICVDVTCGSTSFCRDGICVFSCADISCGYGEHCIDGLCEMAACADIECPLGQMCVDAHCLDSECQPGSCPAGLSCIDGRCEEDFCAGVLCPPNQRCVLREELAQCVADWAESDEVPEDTPDPVPDASDSTETSADSDPTPSAEDAGVFDGATTIDDPSLSSSELNASKQGCACDQTQSERPIPALLVLLIVLGTYRSRKEGHDTQSSPIASQAP
jgi:hypothetical protein